MMRKRMIVGHWKPIVNLLEEYELNKTNPKERSTASFWVGIAILGVGIIGIIYNFGVFADEKKETIGLGQWIYLGSVILMVPGMLLIGSGVSSRVFFTWTRRVKRLSSAVTSIALFACALVSFLCCIIVCYYLIITDPKELDISRMVALGTFSVAFLAIVFVAGIGPVDIGVVKPRSGMSARSWSIFLELVCLAGPMAVATVSVGWSVGTAGLVLSFALALVAYSKFRYSRLDLAFTEAVRIMDDIRSKALLEVEAQNVEESRRRRHDLSESYRELHRMLNSSPSIDRRAVKSFGLTALCVVAEMRARRETDYARFLEGDGRVSAGRECMEMSDHEFALATAQVFDAFIRMLNRSFAPQSKSSGENKELRKSLSFHAL